MACCKGANSVCRTLLSEGWRKDGYRGQRAKQGWSSKKEGEECFLHITEHLSNNRDKLLTHAAPLEVKEPPKLDTE